MNAIEKAVDLFNTNFVNPATIVRLATSGALWNELLAFHGELATDEFVMHLDTFYRQARKLWGDAWWHLDIVNALFAAAKLRRPARYLEIGVRRGRSAATVVRGCPSVDVFACDMWVHDYAGMDNPGEDFVRKELDRHGHTGKAIFMNGDSHELLPQLFRQQPDINFDIITVDGDHSEQGAYDDLRNVIPRLALGGILMFDDIAHPLHPYLAGVWRRATAGNPALITYEYTETGYGIALAVRKV